MKLPTLAEKAINGFPKHCKYPLQIFDKRHAWALMAAWGSKDLLETGGYWLPLEFYQGRCPPWVMSSCISDKEKQELKKVLNQLLRRLRCENETFTLELFITHEGIDDTRYRLEGRLVEILDGIPFPAPAGA
ncbi:MAG: hypothetical protein PHO83_14845 [Geobacteraceae bacterium]|nr:hypothetical protein [Geobacteraceae bacterium]